MEGAKVRVVSLYFVVEETGACTYEVWMENV
jgi:hypothetical protein